MVEPPSFTPFESKLFFIALAIPYKSTPLCLKNRLSSTAINAWVICGGSCFISIVVFWVFVLGSVYRRLCSEYHRDKRDTHISGVSEDCSEAVDLRRFLWRFSEKEPAGCKEHYVYHEAQHQNSERRFQNRRLKGTEKSHHQHSGLSYVKYSIGKSERQIIRGKLCLAHYKSGDYHKEQQQYRSE